MSNENEKHHRVQDMGNLSKLNDDDGNENVTKQKV